MMQCHANLVLRKKIPSNMGGRVWGVHYYCASILLER